MKTKGLVPLLTFAFALLTSYINASSIEVEKYQRKIKELNKLKDIKWVATQYFDHPIQYSEVKNTDLGLKKHVLKDSFKKGEIAEGIYREKLDKLNKSFGIPAENYESIKEKIFSKFEQAIKNVKDIRDPYHSYITEIEQILRKVRKYDYYKTKKQGHNEIQEWITKAGKIIQDTENIVTAVETEGFKEFQKFFKQIRGLAGDFYVLPNKNTVEIFIKDYLVMPFTKDVLERGTHLQSDVNLLKFLSDMLWEPLASFYYDVALEAFDYYLSQYNQIFLKREKNEKDRKFDDFLIKILTKKDDPEVKKLIQKIIK